MAAVASASDPGLTYLTQLLSSSGAPLSGLSSSQLQSVLQDASPSDVVQLSDQALELQNVDLLFGNPDTSQSTGLFPVSDPTSSSAILDNILANLSTTSSSTTPASSSTAPSLADQMASYQSQLQTEEMQTMFGIGSTNGLSGTSLSVLG